MLHVIMPVYKARDTIRDALDSLVAQTKRQFIVTCVQDCDGVDYTDIKEYYEQRLHLRWIKRNENGGPGAARQTGMDCDTMCDYLMFLDADDMLMPNAIERAYAEAKRTSADVVAFSFLRELNHQPPLLMDVNKVPITWSHGKVYRAEYLRENNIRWHPDLRLNEDSYFNLVAWNGTDNVAKVSEVIHLWRDNQNSLTRRDGEVGFFRASNGQYILSQVEGLKKLEEMGHLKSHLVAYTLVNCYEAMMRAHFYKIDENYANQQLDRVRANKTVQDAFNDANYWKAVSSVLHACVWLEDNTLVFYNERFIDWMNRTVKGPAPTALDE